jgi:hypothetical protein
VDQLIEHKFGERWEGILTDASSSTRYHQGRIQTDATDAWATVKFW